jgi:hypothetical protein
MGLSVEGEKTLLFLACAHKFSSSISLLASVKDENELVFLHGGGGRDGER